jgi:hypothetical protein
MSWALAGLTVPKRNVPMTKPMAEGGWRMADMITRRLEAARDGKT